MLDKVGRNRRRNANEGNILGCTRTEVKGKAFASWICWRFEDDHVWRLSVENQTSIWVGRLLKEVRSVSARDKDQTGNTGSEESIGVKKLATQNGTRVDTLGHLEGGDVIGNVVDKHGAIWRVIDVGWAILNTMLEESRRGRVELGVCRGR